MKIDCSITANYLEEKGRMTEKCKINCRTCPLHVLNNGLSMGCSMLERTHPLKAIAIVQKWSDEHPAKTRLSELLKVFPNAKLEDSGIPYICANLIGICDGSENVCINNCPVCWNTPIKE